MTEEQKQILIEKLKLFFDTKIETLTKKFENDIKTIEEYYYEAFDNVIIPLREIKKKEEEEKELEKEKNKEEKEEKEKEKHPVKEKVKKKEEQKIEDQKELKLNISKLSKSENLNLTKTPMKASRKKEIEFKGKTELQPKRSRVFSGKSHKPELNTINETFHKEKKEKKNTVTITEINTSTRERNKSTLTISTKKEHKKEHKKEINKEEKKEVKENKPKKAKGLSASAYKPTGTKKFTSQKGIMDKKGKNDKKKKDLKKDIKKIEIKNKKGKDEDKTEEKMEPKIIIKYKGLNQIPEDLKNRKALLDIYLMIKGNYLSNKENCKLILSNPIIYKNFGSDVKFLLNDKKNELKSKINELESFLKKYDDLPNIVSTRFQPSKSAKKSMMFVKKEEIEKLIKNYEGNIPKEICDTFKLLLYILDLPFDENLTNQELLEFFMSEVLVKPNIPNLMVSMSQFFENNKEINITKEKYEKIDNIIKEDNLILSTTDMARKNRFISYCSFLIREYYKFINLKTSDEIPYYEMRKKNKMLNEYKYQLATIENNGIPPKIEEIKKAENKEVKEEIKETKEEAKEAKEVIEEKKEEIKETKEVIEKKKEEIKETKEVIEEKKEEIKETKEVIEEKKEENQNKENEGEKVQKTENTVEIEENKNEIKEIKNNEIKEDIKETKEKENVEIKVETKEENPNPPSENQKVEEEIVKNETNGK